MKDQQPLYEQFFEGYAKLLRMRLYHYHHNNGGQAKFLNSLIITPWIDDSYHEELNFACQQLRELNEWLANATPYGAELCNVFLDADAEFCYVFHIYVEAKSETLEEIVIIELLLSKDRYEAQLDNYDDVKLTEISDQVWGEMLQEVKIAMSYGTLCLTEEN
jgi:hypothetical protein